MSRTRGFFVLFVVTCSLVGCAPATLTVAPTVSPASTTVATVATAPPPSPGAPSPGASAPSSPTAAKVAALMEGYGPALHAVLGVPDRTPNDGLGDGVNHNDTSFLAAFPYIGTPHAGYHAGHLHK
jgi:hypothetical protein